MPSELAVIRPASASDAAALARIYNHYVVETVVTFEEEPLEASDVAQRIEEAQAAGLPWLVAEVNGHVVGYAYASTWKGRCSFRYSIESSVYLAPGEARKGIGSRLYEQLLADLAAAGIHAVVGGISLPNEASVAFHEKHGFEKVAHFPEIGFKLGQWIDVGYWQRILK